MAPDPADPVRHWPLAGLVLRTPRLVLRPDDDVGLAALADRALDGVHPAEEMPFLEPWTDGAGTPGFARGVMQYAWRCRAEVGPARWSVNFLVREGGRVLGMQTLAATEFGILREVTTGSWLTRAAQGRGLGTEMRQAVIGLAFERLGAHFARTSAFADNVASRRVSDRLGYTPDGVERHVRRGRPALLLRSRLTPEAWRRPEWTLGVAGLGPCRELLGVPPPD
ncbi:GNAT family N-acetyltransferase [Actinomycetospora straminea]|uniref:GNAT family protein n=1 Tax=Actinomycetospora straminea TaxID=663607 RepID=A0ABP9FA73_9PSEU|nr:GNAT family protein [Actinomycetospora straminea]MDD7936666.1 GNAT family protein [Actinomycetospora straminea]